MTVLRHQRRKSSARSRAWAAKMALSRRAPRHPTIVVLHAGISISRLVWCDGEITAQRRRGKEPATAAVARAVAMRSVIVRHRPARQNARKVIGINQLGDERNA